MSDSAAKEKVPPPWGDDPLSRFLHDAQYNERIGPLNLPGPFALLQRIDLALRRAEEAVEKGGSTASLLPSLLLVRSHSSFLGGTRLAFSGELTEANAVLRIGIEQAWYALHVAKDPAPFKRAEVWLRRDEGDEGKKRCREEFQVGGVRATHLAVDPTAAAQVGRLYERTIDYGAHPNLMGLLMGMGMAEAEGQTTYRPTVLTGDTVPVALTLQTAAAMGVAALKVFRHVFEKRFELSALDVETDQLAQGVDSVFKPYASGPR